MDEIFNVATNGRISLNDLFRKMKSIVGASVEPIYAEARLGDVRHSQADISKAKKILDYEPQISLEEGLTRTIEWYRAVAPAEVTVIRLH